MPNFSFIHAGSLSYQLKCYGDKLALFVRRQLIDVSAQDLFRINFRGAFLVEAGCGEVYSDEMSGIKTERPGLQKALAFARTGDTLVIWRLDRLGRSLPDLVQKVEDLKKRGVGFQSLQESIDTTSSVGKFQFHVFSALAEFERNLIRDRTMAGLRAARARGRYGGRRHKLTPEQIAMAARLIKSREVPVSEICKILKVSKPTLYRYVSPTGDIRHDRKTEV